METVADRNRHAAYHRKHWWQPSYVNIDDPEWPWTPKIEGFSDFFCNFGLLHTIQEWIAAKWLETDPDNLHRKFSVLSIDFSSASLTP